MNKFLKHLDTAGHKMYFGNNISWPLVRFISQLSGKIKSLLLGDLQKIAEDPLGTFSKASYLKTPTVYRAGTNKVYYIHGLDSIKDIMNDNSTSFDKATISWKAISLVIGNSLLISSGNFWKKQRRISAPSFQAKKIDDFAPIFIQTAQECALRWEKAASMGCPVNINDEMMISTLLAATRTLFGADVDKSIYNEIRDRLPELFKAVATRITHGGLPLWVPTQKNRILRRSMQPVDNLINKIIADKRKELNRNTEHHGETNNLINNLLLAIDDETGKSMSDQELRDEVVGFFFAGHETTTVALTWVWIVLNNHKEVFSEIRQEIMSKVGQRAPKLSDLPNLEKLNCAILESLRLYPPVWLIERRCIKPIRLEHLNVKVNDIIIFCIYALHRDPRIWEYPDSFIPSRFMGDWRSSIDRYAYIPFGAGPRTCIGMSFALVEMQLILAYLIPRFDIMIEDADQIKPSPKITLRTNREVLMSVRRTTVPL
jgi:cytochrome P450